MKFYTLLVLLCAATNLYSADPMSPIKRFLMPPQNSLTINPSLAVHGLLPAQQDPLPNKILPPFSRRTRRPHHTSLEVNSCSSTPPPLSPPCEKSQERAFNMSMRSFSPATSPEQLSSSMSAPWPFSARDEAQSSSGSPAPHSRTHSRRKHIPNDSPTEMTDSLTALMKQLAEAKDKLAEAHDKIALLSAECAALKARCSNTKI